MKRWVVAIMGAFSAALLVLTAARAAGKRDQAEAMTRTAESLMRANTQDQIDAGKALAETAEAHKQAAAAAEAKMEQRLENIAANNSSLDAVADRFNSRRLRRRADNAAT